MDRLKGKVAVITGAASGMGNGCARVFAQEGATVVLVDFSEKVHAAAEAIAMQGQTAVGYTVDVRDRERLEQIFGEVAEKFGRLDILINAAGINVSGPFLELEYEKVQMCMDVNFMGMWNTCKAALPHMLKNSYGKIVNFSSVTGVMVADPGMTIYSASKGAILAFTKGLAAEFARAGITVNAVLPGTIDTPMIQAGIKAACPDDPEGLKAMLSDGIPMGRMGTVEEAGRAVLFLACDDSSYITGTGIVFDGGNTLPELGAD